MGSLKGYFQLSARIFANINSQHSVFCLNSKQLHTTGSILLNRIRENMDTESLVVNHDKDKCVFYIEMIKEKKPTKALLEYTWVDKSVIDMHHTEVPVEFRGKGVAKILAKDALDFALKEDLKFYLTCTYLQKYVNDNPQPEYTKRLLQST